METPQTPSAQLPVEETPQLDTIPSQTLKKNTFFSPFIISLFIFIVIGIFVLAVFTKKKTNQEPENPSYPSPSITARNIESVDTIVSFGNDNAFIQAFLSQKNSQSGQMETMSLNAVSKSVTNDSVGASPVTTGGETNAQRVSGTNVQVFGIDEPDIVKADSSSIYYSREEYGRIYLPMMMDVVGKRMTSSSDAIEKREIVSVAALPPSAMKQRASIPDSGEMLLNDSILVVLGRTANYELRVSAFNILNASAPKRIWEIPFTKRVNLVGARMYKKELYLVVSSVPSMPRPCPLPLTGGQSKLEIRCSDVFTVSSQPAIDSVYSVIKINAETGEIQKKTSFTGNSSQSVLYMSKDAIYLTYFAEGDFLEMIAQFVNENRGVFPSFLEDKIKKLRSYDLSRYTKMTEFSTVFYEYLASLDENERVAVENNIKNSLSRYLVKYKRTFEYTGIIKLDTANLSLIANGKVPGELLNQFSLDEWKGSLRVATTIGNQNRFNPLGGVSTGDEMVSDVYILDSKLRRTGYVKDLGNAERIYSVRFIADRGYVVTYRETDPLYVLDLSSISSPQVKGELKIPGYSSYLHPLDTYLLLGIGKNANNQLKLSLFDVKDATKPQEISQYSLSDEYWSETLTNHHAFLQDAKYSVFFLPGSRGGYIFSYDSNTLSMVKGIEAYDVKRALYMNDTLYIVANNGITAFKEGTWDKVGDYAFTFQPNPVEIPVIEKTETIPESSNGSTESVQVVP